MGRYQRIGEHTKVKPHRCPVPGGKSGQAPQVAALAANTWFGAKRGIESASLCHGYVAFVKILSPSSVGICKQPHSFVDHAFQLFASARNFLVCVIVRQYGQNRVIYSVGTNLEAQTGKVTKLFRGHHQVVRKGDPGLLFQAGDNFATSRRWQMFDRRQQARYRIPAFFPRAQWKGSDAKFRQFQDRHGCPTDGLDHHVVEHDAAIDKTTRHKERGGQIPPLEYGGGNRQIVLIAVVESDCRRRWRQTAIAQTVNPFRQRDDL